MNDDSIFYIIGFVGLFFTIALAICIIAAWFVSIRLFIKSARMKGHYIDGAGVLWFIGIFTTPIILGLYVGSLADRSTNNYPIYQTHPTQSQYNYPQV